MKASKAEDSGVQQRSGVDASKRRLLISALAAYSASLIPWAWSQPVKDDGHAAFVALSAILTGRQALDEILGDRLYEAFTSRDAGFGKAAQAVLELINTHRIDPSTLQKFLEDKHSSLAYVPRQIALAWYVGVVGEGEDAVCVAYETALMSVIVSDRLKPPTYAYGAYGSWENPPA